MYRGQSTKHWRRFPYLVLTGSVAAIGLACGSRATYIDSPDPTKAHLAGKITHQGKPFPGYILVQSEDNRRTVKATLAKDGSYIVPDVPIGKVKIGLILPPHRGRRPASEGQGSEIKNPNRMLSQYNDPSKSGLTVEIQSGKNEYSVDLP